MNLFYKYSHLQRFEQQNEKDGRNEKGQRRNGKGQRRKDKGERTKDKGERRNGDGRRKKKEKEKTSRQEYHSRKSLFYYFVFEKLANNFLQKASKLESCRKQANLSLAESEQT